MPLRDPSHLPEIAHQLLDIVGRAADLRIALFDPLARITACNDGFLDMWHLPSERAVGRTLDQLGLNTVVHDRLRAQIKHVASSGDVLSDRIAIDRYGAAIGDYSYTLYFIEDRGAGAGVVSVGRMISTGGRRIDAPPPVWTAYDAGTGRVVDNLPEMAWRSLDGGRWIWCSRRWTDVTGLSNNASCGFGWLEAVHPDDRELAMRRWREAKAPNGLEADLKVYDRRESRYRWVQLRAEPSQSGTERVTQWVGLFSDVDHLHRLMAGQQRFIGELQGQLRGVLHRVRSTAGLMFVGDVDERINEQRLYEKLDVLERVLSLASLHESGPITVERVIRTELRAYGIGSSGARLTLAGPFVVPPAQARQALAFIVNELASTALARETLSPQEGSLEVEWTATVLPVDPGYVRFAWRERHATGPRQGKHSGGGARDRLGRYVDREPGCRLLAYDEIVGMGIDCSFEIELGARDTTETVN